MCLKSKQAEITLIARICHQIVLGTIINTVLQRTLYFFTRCSHFLLKNYYCSKPLSVIIVYRGDFISVSQGFHGFLQIFLEFQVIIQHQHQFNIIFSQLTCTHVSEKKENKRVTWVCLSSMSITMSVHFVLADGPNWNSPVWGKEEEISYLRLCFLIKVRERKNIYCKHSH